MKRQLYPHIYQFSSLCILLQRLNEQLEAFPNHFYSIPLLSHSPVSSSHSHIRCSLCTIRVFFLSPPSPLFLCVCIDCDLLICMTV